MKWIRFSAGLIGLLALAVASPPARADGTIEGKLSLADEPLPAAVVELHTDWSGGFRTKPAVRSAPTGADGAFSVPAPAGRYFLIVRPADDGEAFFAFYGGNPVTLADGETISVGVNVGLVVPAEPPTLPGGTGIRGKVLGDGEPLGRARVTLYQDGETIFRGMGYASTLTSAEGIYSFNLEPGKYWVVARKRAGDDRFGPLAAGDLFAYAPGNPVDVVEDSFTVANLNAAAKQVKVREGDQVMTLDGTVRGGETLISGIVRDTAGKPVPGVFVGAYRDSMMIYKPDFISNRTGEDGIYRINLTGGGEYFIIARDTLGAPAARGDLLGRYDGNQDHSVVVKAGEKFEGIDITVEVVE